MIIVCNLHCVCVCVMDNLGWVGTIEINLKDILKGSKLLQLKELTNPNTNNIPGVATAS